MPRPPRDPDRHTTTIRIPQALYWRLLAVMARLRRNNLNDVMVEALERYVETLERADNAADTSEQR